MAEVDCRKPGLSQSGPGSSNLLAQIGKVAGYAILVCFVIAALQTLPFPLSSPSAFLGFAGALALNLFLILRSHPRDPDER